MNGVPAKAEARASYRGIPIGAAPGVHEAAFRLLQRHAAPPGNILDLGTGAGAFLQRLLDAGYDVDGVDISAEGFRAEGRVHRHDLNQPFGQDWGRRTAIAAIELIEHLENPRHLFRECARLLDPGGFLLITTPHIESAPSRVKFLFTGRFEWFEASHYETSGHITPLTRWQLRQIAQETGFALVAEEAGPAPAISIQRRVVTTALQWLMRDAGDDHIRVSLFKKGEG